MSKGNQKYNNYVSNWSFFDKLIVSTCFFMVLFGSIGLAYTYSDSFKAKAAISQICSDIRSVRKHPGEFLDWLGDVKGSNPDFYREQCLKYNRELQRKNAKFLSDTVEL